MDTKQLRKLLNKAWDDACWWRNMFVFSPGKSAREARRYRDVSKIIEEAESPMTICLHPRHYTEETISDPGTNGKRKGRGKRVGG